jgi:ubiquinone biosynthesis protein COQ9
VYKIAVNRPILQEKIKHSILQQAIKIVPFEGWSKEMLRQASVKAGCDENMAELMFMNGFMGMLDYYLDDLDQQMIAKIRALPLDKMKVREKIKQAVVIRLSLMKKPVASKTVSFLALPFNIPSAMSFTWRTVDKMWYEAGDTATDFNHYTKRTLLAGVYSSTLIYWLNDESKDHHKTWEFLDRRIENVLKIGGIIHRFKSI